MILLILHAKQTHECESIRPLFCISEDLSIWTCWALEIYAGNWDAMNAKHVFLYTRNHMTNALWILTFNDDIFAAGLFTGFLANSKRPIAQHVSNGACHNRGAWKMLDALVIKSKETAKTVQHEEWHFIRNSKSVHTALGRPLTLATAARLDEWARSGKKMLVGLWNRERRRRRINIEINNTKIAECTAIEKCIE